MMDPLADADKLHLEVQVLGTIDAGGGVAQNTVTTLHYKRTTVVPSYSGANFLTAWITKCQAAWLAAVSVAWNLDKVTARIIDSPYEAAAENDPNLPGDVVGDCLPSMNTVVITKKTPLRGRMHQGRIFIAGLAESATLINVITAGQIALFNTLKTKLLEQVNAGDGNLYTPMVLSTKYSQLKDDDALGPISVYMTQCTSMTVKEVIRTLDSRKSRLTVG